MPLCSETREVIQGHACAQTRRSGVPNAGTGGQAGAQAQEWPHVSPPALLKPGSGLPRPQTHVFPRVSRLPGTASFALHGKGGDGVWPRNSPPPCPGLRPWDQARLTFSPRGPGSPRSPLAPCRDGSGGDKGIRVKTGETQGGWQETRGHTGGTLWDVWLLGVPHSPALPPGLQRGLQGLPVRERAQWGPRSQPWAPLPRPPTLTFSPFAPGGPTAACREGPVSPSPPAVSPHPIPSSWVRRAN